MSSRPPHRGRSAVASRAGAVGAVGLTAFLAITPFAHADGTPTPTASPEATATASTATPEPTPNGTTSETVSPSVPASSSDSASPSASTSPTASASPIATPSLSPTLSPSASASASPSGTPKRRAAIEPNYGLQKVRLGVKVSPDSVILDGTVTTAGSILTLVETGPAYPGGPNVTTCTTGDAQNRRGAVRAAAEEPIYCPGTFLVQAGDTLTVTQTSAPTGLRLDPSTIVRDPCVATDGPFCTGDDVIFSDPGQFAPTAVPDADTVAKNGRVAIDVLANDNRYRAPVIEVTVPKPPAHGQVLIPDDPTGPLTYVPDADYIGADTFDYTYTTQYGSATATVTIVVTAAPVPTPTSATATAPAADPTHTSKTSGSLADTGLSGGTGLLALAGLVLTGAGAGLVGRGRKRHGRHAG